MTDNTKKLKTPKEMEILIEKLNKREIKWDDIEKELEIMRREERAKNKLKIE